MGNHSVKKMNTYLAVLALAAFLANSCAPLASSAAKPIETAMPPIPTATETATPTATSTTTPEPTAVPTEAFAPMDNLGTPEKPVRCDITDYKGRIQAQEIKKFRGFPENSQSLGWGMGKGETGYSYYIINPIAGSVNVEQIASVCDVSAKFLGEPDRDVIIVGIYVLNRNGSVGLAHVVTNRQDLQAFFQIFSESEGRGIGIERRISSKALDSYKSGIKLERYWYVPKIYDYEGASKIDVLVGELEDTGNVPSGMETVLLVQSVNRFP